MANLHLQTARLGHIARPQSEHSNQYSPLGLRAGCAADAPGHSHAEAEKRGLGRSFWWRCDGEHFRRANDKRPHQGNGLAGRPIFSSYFWAFGSLCPPLDGEQQLAT